MMREKFQGKDLHVNTLVEYKGLLYPSLTSFLHRKLLLY